MQQRQIQDYNLPRGLKLRQQTISVLKDIKVLSQDGKKLLGPGLNAMKDSVGYGQGLKQVIQYLNSTRRPSAKTISTLLDDTARGVAKKSDQITQMNSVLNQNSNAYFEQAQQAVQKQAKQKVKQNQQITNTIKTQLQQSKKRVKNAIKEISNATNQANFAQVQKKMQEVIVKQQQYQQDLRQQAEQSYKATAQQLLQLAGSTRTNKNISLAAFQKNLLNGLNFQSSIPYKQQQYSNLFKYAKPNVPLNQYDYGKKIRKMNFDRSTANPKGLLLNSQLSLLPNRAPNFVKKWLDQQGDRRYQRVRTNQKFQQGLARIAQNQGMDIADLVVNQQYWSKNKAPDGFKWSQQRGQLVFIPQNVHIKQLWSGGMGYKSVPTGKQLEQKAQFLHSTYKTASQSQQAFDKDLIYIINGAKTLGYNPHFGAISKNSPSLYIGAYIDPLTGTIRLPPKPEASKFNPVDRVSMLQYKIMKAMYTWNSNVKAMQQLRKFASQSQRGWKTVVRNKRKNSNILQRTRSQYKNIARKLALNIPIWGVGTDDQRYVDLQKVYGDKESSRTTIINSTNDFANYVHNQNMSKAAKSFQQWQNGTGKLSFGAILRAKAAGRFQTAPQLASRNFLKRTFIKTKPLGGTNLRVQQQSIYAPWARQKLQDNIDDIRRFGVSGAFQTLQSLRSNDRYQDFDIATPFHHGANKYWNKQLQRGKEQDPMKANARTVALYQSTGFQPSFVEPKWNIGNQKKQAMRQGWERQMKRPLKLRQTVLDQGQSQKVAQLNYLALQDKYRQYVDQLQGIYNDGNIRQQWQYFLRALSYILGYQLDSAFAQKQFLPVWQKDKENGTEFMKSNFLALVLRFIEKNAINQTGISSRTRSAKKERYKARMFPNNDVQKPAKRRGGRQQVRQFSQEDVDLLGGMMQ